MERLRKLILELFQEFLKLFSKRPPAPPAHLVNYGVNHVVNRGGPVQEASAEVLIRQARQSMGVDCINYYNFAVCGQAGVGKSSLINGILCLEGNDACLVGEVETTQKIRSCSNKKWPSLKLWDIPGAGTVDHPSTTYFEDKKLYAFDAILILSCDPFSEVDFQIMKSARKFETPCVFVRTKCDIAVQSRAKRDKISALKASERFREDVSKSFHEGLENAGLLGSYSASVPPQLFFISNEFFSSESGEQDAYAIYDRKTKSIDSSLHSMDEQQLIAFLVNAAKRRA